jgi:Putative peptidoglycan binding domain
VAAGVCLGVGILVARAWLPRETGSTATAVEASATATPTPAPPLPSTVAGPSVAVAAIPPTPPAPATDPSIVSRLAAVDTARSLHEAFSTLFSAWETEAFDERDGRHPEHIGKVARRRGLEYLSFTANVAMLKMLDVPAVIELRLPDEASVRYVALTGLIDGQPLLGVDGANRLGDKDLLTEHWLGQAHVVWRDFEKLGQLDPAAHGPAVERLQTLLKRIGTFLGDPTGTYDGSTSDAVRSFQRSRFLEVDARVGRLTRLALYSAVGGYPRPTLQQQLEGKS